LFTVIQIRENRKSGWKKITERFRKPEVNFRKTEITDGKYFYVCEAELHRGKIPFKEIKRISPANCFIMPFNTEGEEGVNEYVPQLLPRIMLFNSAVKYIEKMNVSPSKTQITVVDLKGIHLQKLRELVKLASSVTVITDEEKKYTELSDSLFDSYGISLIIRKEIHSDTQPNSFLFDYDGNNIPLSYNGTVFSESKKYLLNGKTLTPGGFDLPEEYDRLLPDNINKLHFASALYELCDVQELRNLQFNELCS